MKTLLSLIAATLSVMAIAPAIAADARDQYVQIAKIEIDPAQLENYKAAVREQIEAAIQNEPGVLVLYSAADRDNPTRITVFEVYRDSAAYRAHLQSPHFKKYKVGTAKMVKSLELTRVNPIALGAKQARPQP